MAGKKRPRDEVVGEDEEEAHQRICGYQTWQIKRMPRISEADDVMSQILRKWEEVVAQEKAKQPLMFSPLNQEDKFNFTSAHHEALIMCQMIKLTRIRNLFGIYAIRCTSNIKKKDLVAMLSAC